MTWYLVLTIFAGNPAVGVTTTVAPFKTASACSVAGTAVQRDYARQLGRSVDETIVFTCVADPPPPAEK